MLNPVAFCSGFFLVVSSIYLFPNPDQTMIENTPYAPMVDLLQRDVPVGRVAYVSSPLPSDDHDAMSTKLEVRSGRIYVGSRGHALFGQHSALLAAFNNGAQLQVEIPTFHGPATTTCQDTYETDDGILVCSVEFWCEGPARGDIPARHKHVGVVLSNGEVQQAVATTTVRHEEKILHMQYNVTPLTWYRR